MKDYLLPIQRIRSQVSRFQIFDTVIILILLNIVAATLIAFYIDHIKKYSLPPEKGEFLAIKSIPLTPDLNGINASASAYAVYDVENRNVIAGKNQSLRFSPASTAKVMTAILILEYFNLDNYLSVPSNIYSVEGSRMHLVPNEEVMVRDLLYGLMLPSGNDAAYTLASYYPGGLEGFVKAMNKKAAELNLVNTFFVDPAGYEDGNYTTGEELARLGAKAMEYPVFAQIVLTRQIEVTNKQGTHTFYLKNLNELLKFENVVGIKTGFTNEAGGVLLTAIKKKDKLFVVSVLKSPDRFSDTRDIMNFIQEKVDFSLPPQINSQALGGQ